MRPLVIAAAAMLAVVTVLALLVASGSAALLGVDHDVGAALRGHAGGSVEVDVLQVLTAPGLSAFRAVILLPVAIVFAVRRRLRLTGFVLVAGIAVGPLTTVLKELVGRVRPTADDPLVAASGLSFPSGHSSGAAALAGVLLVVSWVLVSRRWRPWLATGLVLCALVVAWTRIALGVHYLSDTVAGLALGAAVVLLSMAAFGIHPAGPERLAPGGRPERARDPG